MFALATANIQVGAMTRMERPHTQYSQLLAVADPTSCKTTWQSQSLPTLIKSTAHSAFSQGGRVNVACSENAQYVPTYEWSVRHHALGVYQLLEIQFIHLLPLDMKCRISKPQDVLTFQWSPFSKSLVLGLEYRELLSLSTLCPS